MYLLPDTMQQKHNTWVKKQIKQYLSGVLFLMGSVIGAWFFWLPHIVREVWIIPSILIISAVGILAVIVHLLLAEVSLSLPGNKNIIELGDALFPKNLATIHTRVAIFQFFFGILIYVILAWWFIQTLGNTIGLHIHHARATCIYVIIIWGMSLSKFQTSLTIDKVIVGVLISSILLLAMGALWQWNYILMNLSHTSSPRLLYSVALLSFIGINAVPLLHTFTGNDVKRTSSIISSSGMLVTSLAIIFTLAVVSLSGPNTTADVTHGLLTTQGAARAGIASIMWLAAIISSHIPVMEHLLDIFVSDAHTSRINGRWILTLLPLLIYLYFDLDFITLLGNVGGILSGLLAMLVCLLNIRLHTTKQKVHTISMLPYDQVWSWVVFCICGIGVLYTIFHLFVGSL
jgi:amino acid permease